MVKFLSLDGHIVTSQSGILCCGETPEINIMFIIALAEVRKSTLADLVQVTEGCNNTDTRFPEDMVLKFAQALNPGFSIWCRKRIADQP